MPRKARYSREEALDRAVILFWSRGYHASSLKDIEQALDMRPGSLYATFGSKQGLFIEALEVYSRRMSDDLETAMTGASGPLDGLCRYLKNLASACIDMDSHGMAAPACMIVKTLLESTGQDTELSVVANRLLDNVENRLARLLEDARDAGELRPETNCVRLARLLQAQMMGMRVFAQRQVDADKVADLADDVVAMLDAYRAGEVSAIR
ncbi:TetR/AcrR family transcriptional regulator [Marinobacter fonticola]|uniref:TetR/AcrR family transcriptional regulator n=1 Tax=Marinobacter fonticola TaxID=2603215 RepID=UPI0011E6DA4E|nr:TetR/AcrR family transcriptional regulator [Marinobacter fonticola]